jgi:Tfp pilus assembly protein PilF
MATIDDVMAAGWRAFEAGDLDRAEQAYRLVIAHAPSTAHAWFMLGATFQVRGRLEEAVASYQQAVKRSPNHSEAYNNLGVALHALRRTEEAIAVLRRALAVAPDYPEAYNNLGNAMRAQGEFDEAEACYRRALALKPDYAEARHNLGNALKSRGQVAEALACYDQALAIQPDRAEVHLSRALTHLEMGDFAQGWPEYEWRLKCPQFAIPHFPQPRWDGRPLAGKTILLYADHGLGDALQFIRYAPMVREQVGRVVVVSRAPIARLLATCAGVDLVVVEGGPMPDCDVYAPLMSLPGIFGTEASSIPAEVPYLSVDPDLVNTWADELALSDDLCIGIAWRGNPGHARDHARSFPLERFETVARRPGVRLFSLQKGDGSEQIAEVADRFPITDLGGRLDDLMDTAAVLTNLDLAIVPDTSLAHLAGALGVPVWVALMQEADWRWMSDRNDSPWYPTMRLFRQRRRGDWEDVFDRIAAALDEPHHSA